MRHCLSVSRHGASSVLTLIEEPVQEMTSDGIRIKVKASGVNFADIMMRMGLYPEAPPPPFTPGYEIAGDVIEVGANVSGISIGDRVLAGTLFGGYTTEVVIPRHLVWKLPEHLSYVDGASIIVNFITSWVALHEMARVREGDRVLVQSAAGGVGLAAVQIAKQAGARVIGLVGSEAKSETVYGFGADLVMLNRDWENTRREDAEGYDIILNSSGGKTLKRDMKALRPAGRIISLGLASMIQGNHKNFIRAMATIIRAPLFTQIKLMNHNYGVYGLNLLPIFEAYQNGTSTFPRDCFDQIILNFENGNFRTCIGKTFPLADGGAAQDHLQSRANIGKVVLEC